MTVTQMRWFFGIVGAAILLHGLAAGFQWWSVPMALAAALCLICLSPQAQNDQ